MFSSAQTEVTQRLAAIRDFISLLQATEQTGSGTSAATREGKGLVFIQLYAVYEYCIVSGVAAAVARVNALSLRHDEIRKSLLSMVLDSDCSSIGASDGWGKRVQLFNNTVTSTSAQIRATLFPKDNSHFRVKQLELIWNIFGVPAPVVSSPHHIGRIEEIVELRNSIAHGKQSPSDIGQRFSSPELIKRVTDIDSICLHFLTNLENHTQRRESLIHT